MITLFKILIPVWLFAGLSRACPVRDPYVAQAKSDIEVEDPDCFKMGICHLDEKLYERMCSLPLIGQVFQLFLSEENKKKTYFVVCLLSGLLALVAFHVRHRSQKSRKEEECNIPNPHH